MSARAVNLLTKLAVHPSPCPACRRPGGQPAGVASSSTRGSAAAAAAAAAAAGATAAAGGAAAAGRAGAGAARRLYRRRKQQQRLRRQRRHVAGLHPSGAGGTGDKLRQRAVDGAGADARGGSGAGGAAAGGCAVFRCRGRGGAGCGGAQVAAAVQGWGIDAFRPLQAIPQLLTPPPCCRTRCCQQRVAARCLHGQRHPCAARSRPPPAAPCPGVPSQSSPARACRAPQSGRRTLPASAWQRRCWRWRRRAWRCPRCRRGGTASLRLGVPPRSHPMPPLAVPN